MYEAPIAKPSNGAALTWYSVTFSPAPAAALSYCPPAESPEPYTSSVLGAYAILPTYQKVTCLLACGIARYCTRRL